MKRQKHDISRDEARSLLAEYGSYRKAAAATGIPKSVINRAALKAPEVNDTKQVDGDPKRVLVIGDTHAPAMHPNYIEFLQETYDKYQLDTVVHIGDAVDWKSISFHAKSLPDITADEEIAAAREQIGELYAAFPEAIVLTGNHDDLPKRRAEAGMVPSQLLRTYSDIWGTPGWHWCERWDDVEIDGVYYRHGDMGKGGMQAALKNAMAEFTSVVQGHHHSQMGVWWHVNKKIRIFGLQTGCGVDPNHSAMDYGKVYSARPALGCGVVLEGSDAISVPMLLQNRYH